MKPASAKAKGRLQPFRTYSTKTTVDEFGRECTRCSTYKTWDSFRKNAKSKTGYQEACKQCVKEKRGKRDLKKEKSNEKLKREALKKIDPFLVKARDLRSRLLARFSKDQTAYKQTTPTTVELYEWLKKHDLVCAYSGQQLTIDSITVDHRTPIARSGTNELDNLAICSHHMNTAKGSMTEYEFRMLLDLVKTWEDGGASLLRRLKQGHFG